MSTLDPGEATRLQPKILSRSHFQQLRAQFFTLVKEHPVASATENEEAQYTQSLNMGRYEHRVVAENKRWRVELFTFHALWRSLGTLVVTNLQNGEALALYTMPPGGSKVLLFVPTDLVLQGDHLQGRFCVECSWWGHYGWFRINLASHQAHRLSECHMQQCSSREDAE
ncbi:hypothetical protein [Magnetococcus sp. PR-3]|uniref:hypothetical protein n=1 Tax=Magnetococcus sp. PR-3 TaxID=3120355 RepID=UPI002FCDF559